VGVFSATLTTAGGQTLTASDTSITTLTGTTGTISVSPAAATSFVVSALPATQAGDNLTFTVVAEDQFNNTATGFAGLVTFSSTDTGTNTTLPTDSPLNNGVETFSATLTTLGDQTLTATQGTTTGTSGPITVTVSTAGLHFVVTAPPTTEAGANLTFTVIAEDQFNNTATGFAGDVTFSSSDSGINTLLPTPSPLSNGVGTLSATLTTAGDQTLTATQGTVTGTSGPITVSAANTSHLVLTAPASTTAGVSFVFEVTAKDRFNNTATGYGGTVAFGTSDPSHTLPGNSALDHGVGTFSATLGTAGNQTLTVGDTTSTAITGATTTILVISDSVASTTHYRIIAPARAEAGVPFNFTVIALDQFNHLASGYTGTVHFSSNDSSAILPANSTLTGGIGVFSAILSKGPGLGNGRTLQATDTIDSTIIGMSRVIKVKGPGPVKQKGGGKGNAKSETMIVATPSPCQNATDPPVSTPEQCPTSATVAPVEKPPGPDLAPLDIGAQSAPSVLAPDALEQQSAKAKKGDLADVEAVITPVVKIGNR
jgi:hypothetical protein